MEVEDSRVWNGGVGEADMWAHVDGMLVEDTLALGDGVMEKDMWV